MNLRITGRVGHWLAQAGRTARLMVGVQDYARYVAHMREHHPELPVLDEGAYCALMQEKRFGGKGVNKCPC